MKADGKVNIDEAAKVGEKIISSMVGKKVADYTFKKANSVSKVNAKNALVIDGDIVTIDPQLLFQRLMLITRDMDEDEIRDVFQYELSQKPSALFDELGFMREANSTSLSDNLWKKVQCNSDNTVALEGCHFVLNGHTLINKIAWQKNETFDAICLKYVKHIAQYEHATVVLDSGFDLTPSIKDDIHLRRTKGIPGKDILFTGNMALNCKKESFLSNKFNTQRFINMLGRALQQKCEVVFSTNPVTAIVKVAVQNAVFNKTVVVGGTIEELVVLCHSFENENYNIWFQPDEKKPNKCKLWNLEKMHEILGAKVMKGLLFMHAVMGSSGTSHLFGLSTSIPIKKFNDIEAFRDISDIFICDQSKISQIVAAGKTAVCILYNGKSTQELNVLRYQRFIEKVVSKTTAVQVQSLPPTESAVHYHSLRTYYRIQTWLGNINLDPLLFGWEMRANMLRPKTTDLQPAPAKLLKKIRCNCGGSCSTMKCNCKKYSMKCTSACGECRGVSCLNSKLQIEVFEEDDEEEDQ